MRFTRLRLNGFKSFVDPTEVMIGDGLTGVVGPNGCGKSNLLEALRWVMGENRPTAMRGEGMEDVIFSGASTRPARNFAEVSIHIDNADRLAPAAFNDADALDIVRRITRDAGSAYKINTRDVRARDVAMLFADASTGAHSPALVRQGQIAELINARPKARRRILEEAAGISGLYQRRHEAELKLNGAETNLGRVDDVLEQLKTQLAALARQARQAARYREIGTELRQAEGMLLYRRWREAAEALAAAEAALTEATAGAASAERAAAGALRMREAAEGAVPPLREEAAIAGTILQRLTVERDGLTSEAARAEAAISELEGQIARLSQDIERETGLVGDADETIARLDWEAAALGKAGADFDVRLAAAAERARAAGQGLQDHEAALDRLNEDAARLSARHLSAERLREDAEKTLTRNEADAARAGDDVTAAEAEQSAATSALEAAGAALGAASQAAEAAEAALVAADNARAAAQAREAEARAEKAAAEGEATALRAEVAGLARLVDRDTSEAAQLLDSVSVAPGFEAALGAALGDDLRAAIGAGAAAGWLELPPYGTDAALPAGTAALGDRVTAPGVLARRLSQIGICAAHEGAARQAELKPGQRLVSAAGDLWRWDGFYAGAEAAPSAAALRLTQINRLVELKRDLEEATAQSAGAAQAHGVLGEQLAELTQADADARNSRRAADQAAAEANRALSRAELDIANGRLESRRMAVTRHGEEADAARARLAEARATLAALDDLAAARAAVEAAKTEVEREREAMLTARAAHDELRREGEARTRRAQEIVKELSGWRHRKTTAAGRIGELQSRKDKAEVDLGTARGRPAEIIAAKDKLSDALATAEKRRAAAADRLAEGEGKLREAVDAERATERAAADQRTASARAEALCEGAREAVTHAVERIEEDLETTPEVLIETLDVEATQRRTAEAIEADVHRLRRQREALGAVNLRAEEDARTVEAEYEALATEKADLEKAIAKLRAGIAGLNREGRERLLTAFEEVSGNFTMLFKHLFGGGDANLVMVESDDPLEAGLEIMCQPPGKKLSTLSLLSGGEQTLTALSLIFAVFLANPSPICVLDEVDAPLDDANVTRFCDLLDEMCRRTETRFMIITHHAITMSRMDRLFGVTMAEQGVSQLVSVDLKGAEALVA